MRRAVVLVVAMLVAAPLAAQHGATAVKAHTPTGR